MSPVTVFTLCKSVRANAAETSIFIQLVLSSGASRSLKIIRLIYKTRPSVSNSSVSMCANVGRKYT